jgi:hypothetical protein
MLLRSMGGPEITTLALKTVLTVLLPEVTSGGNKNGNIFTIIFA